MEPRIKIFSFLFWFFGIAIDSYFMFLSFSFIERAKKEYYFFTLNSTAFNNGSLAMLSMFINTPIMLCLCLILPVFLYFYYSFRKQNRKPIVTKETNSNSEDFKQNGKKNKIEESWYQKLNNLIISSVSSIFLNKTGFKANFLSNSLVKVHDIILIFCRFLMAAVLFGYLWESHVPRVVFASIGVVVGQIYLDIYVSHLHLFVRRRFITCFFFGIFLSSCIKFMNLSWNPLFDTKETTFYFAIFGLISVSYFAIETVYLLLINPSKEELTILNKSYFFDIFSILNKKNTNDKNNKTIINESITDENQKIELDDIKIEEDEDDEEEEEVKIQKKEEIKEDEEEEEEITEEEIEKKKLKTINGIDGILNIFNPKNMILGISFIYLQTIIKFISYICMCVAMSGQLYLLEKFFTNSLTLTSWNNFEYLPWGIIFNIIGMLGFCLTISVTFSSTFIILPLFIVFGCLTIFFNNLLVTGLFSIFFICNLYLTINEISHINLPGIFSISTAIGVLINSIAIGVFAPSSVPYIGPIVAYKQWLIILVTILTSIFLFGSIIIRFIDGFFFSENKLDFFIIKLVKRVLSNEDFIDLLKGDSKTIVLKKILHNCFSFIFPLAEFNKNSMIPNQANFDQFLKKKEINENEKEEEENISFGFFRKMTDFIFLNLNQFRIPNIFIIFWFCGLLIFILSSGGFVVLFPSFNNYQNDNNDPYLRVMTYNTFQCFSNQGLDNNHIVLDIIKKYRSNLVGFQEIDCSRSFSNNAGMLQYLSHHLKYNYFQGIESRYNSLSAGILSPFQLENTDSGTLPDVTHFARPYSYSKIFFNGKNIHFYVVHVEFKDQAIAQKQVQYIIDKAEYFVNQTEPVIIVGDFNWVESAQSIKMMKNNGFIDVIEQFHGVNRTSNKITFVKTGEYLDYVFYKGSDLTVINSTICSSCGGSDHYPVMATFKVN